jgi:hypothetical protein
MTMHFDRIDVGWLDRATAFLASHGAHPYAVLEDWEVRQFQERFKGVSEVAKLESQPLFVYHGGATVYLYDLAARPDSSRPTFEVRDRFDRLGCVPPQPPPTPSFEPRPGGGH